MTETPDGYVLSKSLVNGLILAILTSLVAIGGYMIAWNAADKQWKARADEKLEYLATTVTSNQLKLDAQILPQAAWRLDGVESWMDEHEKEHRRQ